MAASPLGDLGIFLEGNFERTDRLKAIWEEELAGENGGKSPAATVQSKYPPALVKL